MTPLSSHHDFFRQVRMLLYNFMLWLTGPFDLASSKCIRLSTWVFGKKEVERVRSTVDRVLGLSHGVTRSASSLKGFYKIDRRREGDFRLDLSDG